MPPSPHRNGLPPPPHVPSVKGPHPTPREQLSKLPHPSLSRPHSFTTGSVLQWKQAPPSDRKNPQWWYAPPPLHVVGGAQVPQKSEPPQPSSDTPQSYPSNSHVSGVHPPSAVAPPSGLDPSP